MSSKAIPIQLRIREGQENPSEIKVLITGKLHDIAIQTLKNPPQEYSLPLPISLKYLPDCSRDTLLKEVKDAHVLITRSETSVDKEVITRAQNLSVIARAAVGYGNIDLESATKAGILVLNTPGKNTNSAAELTMALMLGMFRRIPEAHNVLTGGGWDRHRFTGSELMGKTLGIVGLGNVGYRVAQFARGFDMKVLAYDPYVSDSIFRKHGCEKVKTLEELLPQVDILSVHVPLNQETKGMIGKIELTKMKRGAWVVNAARGGLIREEDLKEVLDDGYLSGAAVDTWVSEPNVNQELVNHEKMYVATQHIGASTLEAQERIGRTVSTQVLRALKGEIVQSPVNLPHVKVFQSNLSKHYSVLVEKMSRLASQVMDFNPKGIAITLNANVNKEDLNILKLTAIKGFLAQTSNEFVSYVNAQPLLEKRGISIEVKVDSQGKVRDNGVLVEVVGSEANESASVAGLLYDNKLIRLYSINKFEFEMEPSGELLVIQNHDRPGVIGDVGMFLAKNEVNIAQFELSRNSRGELAMSIIRCDSLVDEEKLSRMRRLPNIISVKRVEGL